MSLMSWFSYMAAQQNLYDVLVSMQAHFILSGIMLFFHQSTEKQGWGKDTQRLYSEVRDPLRNF